MDNVINMDEKLQKYKENVEKLNKNELILKLRQAQMLINRALEIVEDPEDK